MVCQRRNTAVLQEHSVRYRWSVDYDLWSVDHDLWSVEEPMQNFNAVSDALTDLCFIVFVLFASDCSYYVCVVSSNPCRGSL